MLYALDNENLEIFSDDAVKGSQYYCRFCEENLIFKKGRIKIPHFSHFPQSVCPFKQESYNHLMAKYTIKKYLNEILNTNYKIDIEKIYQNGYEKRIADVFIRELNLIIEIQCSSLNIDEWKARNNFYKRFAKKIIWYFDFQSYFNKKQVSDSNNSISHYRQNTLIRYLSSFSEILLFDFKCAETLFKLKLFDYKESWVEEYDNYEIGDTFGGYYRKCKTLREFSIEPIEWIKVLGLKKKEVNLWNYF